MTAVKILIALVVLLFSFLVLPGAAQATTNNLFRYNSNNYVNTSFFPRCPNPGGTQVAYYAQGWHWIVGEANLKWGSDSVNNIGSGNYVQCFCPLKQESVSLFNSQGIQTNWLKVSNITSEQKSLLLSQGWILVQNGADFGLASEPYLAKNSQFFCSGPSCLKNIIQSNSATITNIIKVSSNTGNNNASLNTGGSTNVVTGSSSSQVTVVNKVNINSVSN